MATTDVRSRGRRRASSKFKLVVHLAAPHWVATYRTRRACAVAVDRAARFGCWQSAAQDRFAGFLSEDWLVGHGSLPEWLCPSTHSACCKQRETPMEHEPKLSHRSRYHTSVSRTALLETARRTGASYLTSGLLDEATRSETATSSCECEPAIAEPARRQL